MHDLDIFFKIPRIQQDYSKEREYIGHNNNNYTNNRKVFILVFGERIFLILK